MTAALWLSFEEAAVGCTKTITLTTDAPCAACGGAGAGDAAASACTVCAGSGAVGVTRTGVVRQGGVLSSLPPATPCPACGGAGTRVIRCCAPCNGAGVIPITLPVDVAVPPGATAATALRLRGRGHARRAGDAPGPPGDAYILLTVRPSADDGATRRGGGDGLDVVTAVRVSVPDAVLGSSRTLRTLRGGSVRVVVPPGSQHGDVVAVLPGGGAGVDGSGGAADDPTPPGDRRTVGDHVFVVQLAVPTSLTAAGLAAATALRELQERRRRA